MAFVTGASRGQGRNHALRLAARGVDIIAVGLCGPVDSVGDQLVTTADLAETVAIVEKSGFHNALTVLEAMQQG